jgi:enterochelin esterase-like enzyme
MKCVVAAALGLFACTLVVGQQPAADTNLPAKTTYKLGPDSQVREGVPTGKLVGPTTFKSKVFAGTVRQVWVYVPAQYKQGEAASVIVFQDGQRAINPKGVIRAPVVLDNLIHAKQIPVTIGIFATPGHKGDEYPATLGTSNPNNRSVEYDSMGDNFAKFVVDELVPEVAKTYTLSDKPEDRAIAGFSSGGIAAFTVAWERPDAFRRVYSAIGSFTNLRGGHVYPDLVAKGEAKPIRVFLQDGIHDNRSSMRPNRDWYLQNLKMVAALREKDYDYKFVLGAGGHADDHGGAILPDALRWLWRDHPAVK